MKNLLILGPIIHSRSFDELEIITDGFLAVQNGKIVAVDDSSNLFSWRSSINDEMTEIKLSETQFLLPGFIDCHIHAAQMPNIGLGYDKDLLGWLNSYTFPIEAQYSDTKFAAHVYEKVVKRTLHAGTTFACYFATNHKDGSLILAKEVLKQGQRAFVGKVSSNCSCPDFYIETTDNSIKDNIAFIGDVLSLKSRLVQPIITPRFALSCDMNLMKELSSIASKYDLNIQSHISESLGELALIKNTYKKNYTNVYDEANLLSKKCIMAHGVHLDDDEISLLKKRGTSIAHCPASNTNLGSGLCDVKRLMNTGINVGLGTDVSGGNEASIHHAMKQALAVSHHINFAKKQYIQGTGSVIPKDEAQKKTNDDYLPLDYKQALYLATLGGAQALSMAHEVGNFEVGKDFDALVCDTKIDPIDNYVLPKDFAKGKTKKERLSEMLQKFIYVGDDRNIIKVFVNGKQVK